jgi:sugar-specific transcriptional regulator TrmB
MYEKLLHVGLTGTEAKIYLMLLDISKAQAGVLARKTGIHRRSVYDALDRLIEKGLVAYIVENGLRFYMPEDPKRLQTLIDDKRDEIYSVLPQLHAKYSTDKGKQETLFFRGKQGIKTVFEDQIRDGKDVYIMGASPVARELIKYYLPHYTTKRIAAKMKLHLLYYDKRQAVDKIPFSKVKYLPKKYDSLVSTNIYGNKCVIIIWLPHDPVAILIKQPDVARAFKGYFEMLWALADK